MTTLSIKRLGNRQVLDAWESGPGANVVGLTLKKHLRTAAPLLLISLVVYLSGCSSYHRGYVPALAPQSEEGVGGTRVRVGSQVRIKLKTGQRVHGKVGRLDGDGIDLVHRENYGGQDLSVPYSEIDSVDVRFLSDGEIEGVWFVGLGVALVGGTLWGLQNAFGE